jgi:hypothetical protein
MHYWPFAVIVFLAILWRDRIVLALLILVLPKSWLGEAFAKVMKKGGAK